MQEITELDDHELVTCAQQGDRQAFGELVARHQRSIVSMIYHFCGDPHLAEDAAQEAFVRAWLNLKHYKPQYAFRSWLYRIAVNSALDNLRRERPGPGLDSLPLIDLQTSPPEQAAETRQRTDRIRQAVQALTPPLRMVLILREYQELSYQEIGALLELPIGTVMSRLNSARSQLRQVLSDLSEET